MGGKCVLVTGGARSGKSEFAEQYVEAAGKKIIYIATAQVYDEEMRRRVTIHQERRPANWQTVEAPQAADLVMREAVETADAVLFDCLSMYLTNLVFAENTPQEVGKRQSYILEEMDRLLDAACQGKATVVFVTNEVGLSIVPENALAREFRDLAGLVNQRFARRMQEVYLVVAGLGVELKKLSVTASAAGKI
ncbi:MAG: bifunctional adenosylcobinamide kinase/adenosylcobinamide-phosphate guanylyltransferase [Pelosinus sp.]|nr:bifunctional adenosylcobinamide kinase/adenosylcobinamide-phosphate guanylyltransferase [Pelosinus sp.]